MGQPTSQAPRARADPQGTSSRASTSRGTVPLLSVPPLAPRSRGACVSARDAGTRTDRRDNSDSPTTAAARRRWSSVVDHRAKQSGGTYQLMKSRLHGFKHTVCDSYKAPHAQSDYELLAEAQVRVQASHDDDRVQHAPWVCEERITLPVTHRGTKRTVCGSMQERSTRVHWRASSARRLPAEVWDATYCPPWRRFEPLFQRRRCSEWPPCARQSIQPHQPQRTCDGSPGLATHPRRWHA